jgi:protein-S-isoprenylcysteine O-methyltransferase Ste14
MWQRAWWHTPEMDTLTHDGAAVRLPPPLVYLGALVIGGLLHVLVFPLPLGLPMGLRIALAAAAALGGVMLVASAIGLFRRTGQDPKPWESTPAIISTGIYRFTRNPMYVGMAMIQLSIGIGWGNGWIVALLPVVMVLIYWIAVRHEEAYLEGKFGDVYLAYKRSVRRWL